MKLRRFGVWATTRDWVIAAGVAIALLVTALASDRPATNLDVLSYTLLLASGLILGFHRQAPIPVLIFTGLFAVGYQSTGLDLPVVAFLFAVYASMRAGHRLITVVTSVAVLAALPLAALATGMHDTGAAFAQARSALEIAWLIAAGAAGEALRQAEQRADEAERTREETARHRAAEERLHIARELHDSLTHQISIVKVQTEVIVQMTRKGGKEVSEPLLAIQTASREASRELRATLEALRDDDTTPPLGINQITQLVDRAHSIGLDAVLTIEGHPHDLPAAVGRTAYRIVQEALTNTARHASASTVSIGIDYRPNTLAIRIDDDGQAMPYTVPVPGMGLIGMRERVTALGGRLQAEPRSEGGFSIQVELPADRVS